MKIKLAAVVALAVFCLTAGLLWLMDEKVSEERDAAMESGLRSSVNAISQALQADLRGLRRAWPAGTTISRDRVDWKSLKPFVGVAMVKFDAGPPSVIQAATDPKGPLGNWANEQWNQSLATWKKNTVPVDGSSMNVLLDVDKHRFIGTLWRDGERTWLAVSTRDLTQNLIDLQKGPHFTLALLNSNGRIVAHSTDEYVGTFASDGSIYQNVLSDSGSRAYRNQTAGVSEPSVLAFEKIPRTDLTAVAFRPLAEMQAERRRMLLFGGLAGTGLLLVAVSLVWFFAGSWEKEQEEVLAAAYRSAAKPAAPLVTSVTTAAAAGGPGSVNSQSREAGSPAGDVGRDRHEVALRIASALGHELRAPISTILGLGQIVLGVSRDRSIGEPVDAILREARGAREVLDKLLAFSGEKHEERAVTSLETMVAKVLTELDARFRQRQIYVKRELPKTAEISFSILSVERALKHVLTNSIESMDRMMKKEIKIDLTEDNRAVTVTIADTGEGMESEALTKAMDPFFTTRNPNLHIGMGLPAALGIVKEHGGEMRIDSARGKGTTVTMIFPKQPKVAYINDKPVELRTEEKVLIPANVPTAPASAAAPAGASANLDEKTMVIGTSPTDFDVDALLSPAEDPKKVVAAAPAPRAEPPEAPEAHTRATSATVQITRGEYPETVPLNNDLVAPPKFAAPEKTSRLDAVKVAIRRPGAAADRGPH